jgi:hypothetical protein
MSQTQQELEKIDFTHFNLQVDPVLLRFKSFLKELDSILASPREIIDSSFSRMGVINDEILDFARQVEIEMLRIKKAPESSIEELYAQILDRNDVKMAFDLIMQDFVDRTNYLQERVKSDIDDTVGKMRNFLKHTLRDLVAIRLNAEDKDSKQLYVKIYYEGLRQELERTRELLNLIKGLQTRFEKTKMTPEIFGRIRRVFEKDKLIAPSQWIRIVEVLESTNRYLERICTAKKHLMRCTDFFEFQKKVDLFAELSMAFVEKHQEIRHQGRSYRTADYKDLASFCVQFEGILLDLGSFLEFMTYEVNKRECLNYKEAFIEETALRGMENLRI